MRNILTTVLAIAVVLCIHTFNAFYVQYVFSRHLCFCPYLNFRWFRRQQLITIVVTADAAAVGPAAVAAVPAAVAAVRAAVAAVPAAVAAVPKDADQQLEPEKQTEMKD